MAEIDKMIAKNTAQTKNKIRTPTNAGINTMTNAAKSSHLRTTSTKATTSGSSKPNTQIPATKPRSTVDAVTSSKRKVNATLEVKSKVNRTLTTTTAQRKVTVTKSTGTKSITSENQSFTPRSQKTPSEYKTTKSNTILNTPHNVTITTPPMQRKSEEAQPRQTESKEKTLFAKSESKKKVLRTGSRTLEPDEIVVLRRESAKRRFEETTHIQFQPPKEKSPVRPAVAFEVNFSGSQEEQQDIAKFISETEYSDDCESSFSSHSTIVSTCSNNSSSNSSNDQQSEDDNDRVWQDTTDESANEEEKSATLAEPKIKSHREEENEEESQGTPYPSTVIFKERRLDSGNYEINSQKNNFRTSEVDNSSLDTISATRSEHFDSGISNYSNYASHNKQHTSHNWEFRYSGYMEFVNRPVVNRRGRDLMKKIRKFDEVTFGIYESKPLSYDIYMLSYGSLNTMQSYTQTHDDNRISRDSQTDEHSERNMWTQHPPLFDRQRGSNLTCGIGNATYARHTMQQNLLSVPRAQSDEMPQHHRGVSKQMWQHRKPFTYDALNAFLMRSALVLAQIFDDAANQHRMQQQQRFNGFNNDTAIPDSISYHDKHQHHHLNMQVLNALRVVRVFGSSRHNIVITVHESLPDVEVYRADFSNLLMVWSCSDCADNKPIRFLSTWSEVCRAEISYDSADLIVCGLRDGSVALWNLQESHSYCSKLDGFLTHFAATHSIVPKYSLTVCHSFGKRTAVDLGATIDVKSFRNNAMAMSALTAAGHIAADKSIQFVSLHDNGLLTIWTLVHTKINYNAFNGESTSKPTGQGSIQRNTRFEFSSPWAQMKLIQGATCDLRAYLERSRATLNAKTQFEKAHALFQLNICSNDARLQLTTADADALARTATTMMNLRFTALAAGADRIYVCSNRNFVLSCTRTMKWERIGRIVVNECRSLFLTTICVLGNENMLAVGLANGAVVIINCSAHIVIPSVEQQQPLSNAANSKSQQTNAATVFAISADQSAINDFYPETAKSCAIQNIILSEKHITTTTADEPIWDSHDQSRRLAILTPNSGRQRKASPQPPFAVFERRVCDELLLLSGSDLRENLVQSLELTNNGTRLFVLSNNRLRAYDFELDAELKCDMQDVRGLAITRNDLVIHSAQNNVNIYQMQ